jgi:hypothetical protein
MTEEFLQFIWEQRLFDARDLKTITGEKLEILETGTLNRDSGPDFFNAKVKIGNTLWVGNVEIHKISSDWYRHQHHLDEMYGNTILHVVRRCDTQVLRQNGEEIPTMVLSVPPEITDSYEKLMASNSWIPCQERIPLSDPLLLKIGFNRLMIERLQEKTGEITDRLERNTQNWKETFYQFLSRGFGFKINAMPFELLAKSLPCAILEKHRDNLLQLESLLFGQAGLLHRELLGDDYFLRLREEYIHLLRKYHLKPIDGHLWKFLRIRPVNFPTIRIAQLAALFFSTESIFMLVDQRVTLREVKERLRVCPSDYWTDHFRFSHPSSPSSKHLGESALENLIINCVAPFLFVYGEKTGRYPLKDLALEWLDQLTAEENSVITGWKNLGIETATAFESQALLQLKTRYCDRKRCLHCHIGARLIKTAD